MNDFFSLERFDWFWRTFIAQSVIIFFFICNLINLSLPLTGEVRPFFILMIIYYWAIYRPTLIPPAFLFLLGVAFDFIVGFPLGLHAVIFLVVQWIIRDQRVFLMGQPYIMVWIGFALTSLSVGLLEWIFFSLQAFEILSIKSVLGTLVTSVLFFPLVTLLFILVHRLLPVVPKSLH